MRATLLRSLPAVTFAAVANAQSPMRRCRRPTEDAWAVATYLKSVK